MKGLPAEIVNPNIEHFKKFDPDYAALIQKKLK